MMIYDDLAEAGKAALDRYGFGLASVRFICGTQEEHKTLEAKIAEFLGMEDSILYAACFDANGGLFETLLGPEDAIISDALNHASIIDGIRLSKAARYRYAGVCDLAEKYDAMVMVDDCHATGFLGAQGRGSHEYCDVMGRIDILTGTLGKALGGASGGYTAGKAEVIDWLRQRSRPYLFSNTLAPVIAAASLKVFDLIEHGDSLRARLWDNTARFRVGMSQAGFTLAGADHPIIPVMLGEAAVAAEMAERMMTKGIYVTAFAFPVVPKGQARIRTQMSAAHSPEEVDRCVAAFVEVGREMGVIA